jgi:hypothetical protein
MVISVLFFHAELVLYFTHYLVLAIYKSLYEQSLYKH